MSKVVLVCSRDPRRSSAIQKILQNLHREIIPDNIDPIETRLMHSGNAHSAVINPHSTLSFHKASVMLGHIVGECENWWQPGSANPNGAFALFRVDKDFIELVTDSVASRTIWYIKTDDIFIASTSQRAIIMLLGSYEPNTDAAVWMLSSGCLGPGNSWDARINFVQPGSKILFDRNAWSVKTTNEPISLAVADLSHVEHRAELTQEMENVFSNLEFDCSKFTFPLSGGVDSRGLLMMLKEKNINKCITWGRAESVNDTGNDAHVAKLVAAYYGLDHEYLTIDESNEPVETIFHRFLVCGEGRVATFSGYADGFNMWKSLYEQGLHGVLRGEQAFGRHAVENEADVRSSSRLTMFSDLGNIPNTDALDFPSQCVGENLSRQPKESLEAWRDRTYQAHSLPVMAAGLADLKISYVEILTPLISNSIVEQIRTQPDHLRTEKQLWSEIVRAKGPDIPFAERNAPASLGHLVSRRDIVELMLAELNAVDTPGVVSGKILEIINSGIRLTDRRGERRNRIKSGLRPFIPRVIRKQVSRARNKSRLDINVLAFRAFIVRNMHRMLYRDAALNVQQ